MFLSCLEGHGNTKHLRGQAPLHCAPACICAPPAPVHPSASLKKPPGMCRTRLNSPLALGGTALKPRCLLTSFTPSTCTARPARRTDELRWLVLDEADRLLDLGFEKKIGQQAGRPFSVLFLDLQRLSWAGGVPPIWHGQRLTSISLGARLVPTPYGCAPWG